MKFKPRHIFFILSVLFLMYSFSIYMKPISINENARFDKEQASKGRLVWQAYNCQSCHQLYSLGGYLGPDLTNIISDSNKGEKIVRAFVKSGTKQMPTFNLTDHEMDLLIEFLKSTDASGKSDVRGFSINKFGMIKKNENK